MVRYPAIEYGRSMSLDLFATDRPTATLHPDFVKVRDDPRNAPARAMMTRVAERMEDSDGNLIEQFQHLASTHAPSKFTLMRCFAPKATQSTARSSAQIL